MAFGPISFITRGPEFDLVIHSGRVIDPDSSLDGIRNVGIRGGRIVAVTAKQIRGTREIDAKGLTVAAGFIDPISHGQNVENDAIQVFDGVTTKLQMESGVEDQDAWHKLQAGNRICNYGAGCGHGTARGQVLGKDHIETQVATHDEIARMAQIIDGQLKKGALGVGFGLEYLPGTTREEVFAMFRVAGKYTASCHPHIRYGTLLEEQHVLTAIEEVVACSVATGAPLHIVHVPSMALGNTALALEFIEAAQRRGADLTCDFYPYTAFGTGIGSEVFADGWQQRFGITYSDLEWAASHERLTAETFAKYRAEGKGMCIAHAIPEKSVQTAVKSTATMVGSDGGLDHGVGHPRSSGTFCRVIGHYSRDLNLIPLPLAIEKCGLRAAKRIEKRCADFRRKGRVQVGADADLIVFDAKTVGDQATFDKPAVKSVGMRYVLIHGQAVVDQGQLRDIRPGRGLRAPLA